MLYFLRSFWSLHPRCLEREKLNNQPQELSLARLKKFNFVSYLIFLQCQCPSFIISPTLQYKEGSESWKLCQKGF